MVIYQFLSIIPLLQISSYFIILVLMIIEGPITTIAAASAASYGYFNIYIIFILAILGDLIGDLVHYFIGKVIREKIIEKYGRFFKFKKEYIENIEKSLKNHLGKTLFVIKMTPPLSTPGLLLTGASKVNFKKFIFWSLIIALPKTIFFTFLGYYFGLAINSSLKYLKWGEYGITAIIITTIVVYFLSKYINKKFVRKEIKELSKV